jgi:hypothetical protein
MRWVAALVVLVPMIAGCGAATSQDATVSPDVLASSAEKVKDVGSSRMSWNMKIEAVDGSGEMTGEGIFDYRRNVGRITFDLSALEPDFEKMEMILDGSVVYTSGFGEELAPGKSWMKIDTAKVPSSSELGGLGQIDSPAQELKYLRAVSKEVEEVGEEEVRGVPTTRYRAVIDVRKLGEVAASDAPPRFRKQTRREAMALFEEAGVDEAPMDVWIDGDGLLRKMTMELAFKAEGEKARTELTLELFDFGVPVQVSLPPAAETVDISDLELMGLPQEGE